MMDMPLTNWKNYSLDCSEMPVLNNRMKNRQNSMQSIPRFMPKFLKKSADAFSWMAMRLTYSLNLYRGGCWTEGENGK